MKKFTLVLLVLLVVLSLSVSQASAQQSHAPVPPGVTVSDVSLVFDQSGDQESKVSQKDPEQGKKHVKTVKVIVGKDKVSVGKVVLKVHSVKNVQDGNVDLGGLVTNGQGGNQTEKPVCLNKDGKVVACSEDNSKK